MDVCHSGFMLARGSTGTNAQLHVNLVGATRTGIHTRQLTIFVPVLGSSMVRLCKHKGGVVVERGRRALHVVSDAQGRNNNRGD
jgi:hypothetical protein